MIYRLLAINIDGTLLTSGNKIARLTRAAIQSVQAKDVLVTLFTSQNFAYAKKIASHLKIETPLITHDGGYIATINDEPLFINRIGEELTKIIVKLLSAYKCQIVLLEENKIIANKTRWDDGILGIINIYNNAFEQVKQYVPSLIEAVEAEDINPINIEVKFENKADLAEVIAMLTNMYPEVSLTAKQDKILKITAVTNTKLYGLSFLCNYYEIPLEETVVIGNSEADLALIRAAGLGVAMGNAPFEVKKIADWVTRSNDEHGVAYMVNEHFRKQQPLQFLRKMNIIK